MFQKLTLEEFHQSLTRRGAHSSWGREMVGCVMQLANRLSGDCVGWDDWHPKSVCPAIGDVMVVLNDCLPAFVREIVLKPLVLEILGTADKRNWVRARRRDLWVLSGGFERLAGSPHLIPGVIRSMIRVGTLLLPAPEPDTQFVATAEREAFEAANRELVEV